MKIVDIAEFYSEHGGGVKTYIQQKLSAARARGHEVVIIAPGPRTYCQETPQGRIWWVKAARIPFDPRYYLFTRSADVHAILDQEKPDLVEASSTWRGAWIAASWRGRAPRALVLHQEPVSVYPHTLLDRWLESGTIDKAFGWFWSYLRQLQSRFDTSVVSGDWLADRFAAFGMARPQVVPFGINKSDFSPGLRDEGLRASLLTSMGLDPQKGRLLINVSRHHPEKRLKTVFKAVAQANETGANVGLLQVGSGPFTKAVTKAAAGNQHIQIAGFVGDRQRMSTLLASSDAMIHGGAAETFGIVLAEGLSSGLPLIVPDSGGAYDMGSCKSGLTDTATRACHSEIYQTGNAADCTRALLALLQRDTAALHAGVARAAAQRVLNHEDHFERLFAHYAVLAARKAGRPAPATPAMVPVSATHREASPAPVVALPLAPTLSPAGVNDMLTARPVSHTHHSNGAAGSTVISVQAPLEVQIEAPARASRSAAAV